MCGPVSLMPNPASYRTALEVEKELLKSLAEKEPTFAEISHYLSELVAPLLPSCGALGLRAESSDRLCPPFLAVADSALLARMLSFKTSRLPAP